MQPFPISLKFSWLVNSECVVAVLRIDDKFSIDNDERILEFEEEAQV